MYDTNASLAQSFVNAVNNHDIGDLMAVVSDDVELRVPRGTRRGRREAAAWLGAGYEHVDMRFEAAKFLVAEHEVIGLGDLVFTWKETGEFAERVQTAAVWKVEGGLIRSWQPFESAADAFRAAGILPEPDIA
jgi:ketosteroid isomerase-like protein